MTSFTEPDLVECPYCAAKHERTKLASFNNFWTTYYSDGGESFAVHNYGGLIARCSECNKIISNTYDLPSVGEVVDYKLIPPGFLKKLIGIKPKLKTVKRYAYPRLTKPSVPEWHDAMVQEDLPQGLKQRAELIFYQEFNQLLVTKGIEWKEQHYRWKDEYRSKHQEIEEKLLLRFKDSDDSFTSLVLADIYRRRGDFSEAGKVLESDIDEEQSLYKKYLTQWVKEKNTSLMTIPYE